MGDAAAAALFGINAAALVATVVAPTVAAAPSPSYAALWQRPPLVMISADLLVGLTLMKPRRQLMGLSVLLLFASSVSLDCLLILLMALDICLDIRNLARKRLITLIWFKIGLL
jgi:hypothetical protein